MNTTIQPPQQQAPAPGANQGLTATELAAAVAQAVAQNIPQQPQMQQQLSPEQIAELRGTYTPNEQLLGLLFGEQANPQTRLQALQELVEGIRYNALREAQIMHQHGLQQLYQHIQEPLEDARYLGQQRFMQDLYQGHDGLKQYEPFVKEMLPQFEKHEQYPQDRAARAEFVRKQMVDIIKKHNPQFDPTKGQPQQQPLPHTHAFGQMQHVPSGGYQPTPAPQHSPSNTQPASLPSLGGGGSGAAAAATPSAGSLPWATTLANGTVAPF